jgi:hypothetical protein
MDLTNVQFINSSEEINSRADEYWTLVMDIARKNNLKRIIRCRCDGGALRVGGVTGLPGEGRGKVLHSQGLGDVVVKYAGHAHTYQP